MRAIVMEDDDVEQVQKLQQFGRPICRRAMMFPSQIDPQRASFFRGIRRYCSTNGRNNDVGVR